MVMSLYLARYHAKRITILYMIWISIICIEAITYWALLAAAPFSDPVRILLLDAVTFKDILTVENSYGEKRNLQFKICIFHDQCMVSVYSYKITRTAI